MSLKMMEASQATAEAIEQNGIEDDAESSSPSEVEGGEPEALEPTKGDEEREIDANKQELLKVR